MSRLNLGSTTDERDQNLSGVAGGLGLRHHYQATSMSVVQILSPLPGTFYRRPAPDSPVFKADGDTVTSSDVIGLVEVMKNFQEVTADVDGHSIRFFVEDGAAIMAGEVIAEVEA
jgi:acetyl-CoA carboxylase biotin carboxyl carrier protein